MYAITSCIAIILGYYGAFAEFIRDIYEAFVIYSFFNLIIEYCGGETDCVYMMENEPNLKIGLIGSHIQALPKETMENEKSVDIGFINEGVYALHNLLKLKDFIKNRYSHVDLQRSV